MTAVEDEIAICLDAARITMANILIGSGGLNDAAVNGHIAGTVNSPNMVFRMIIITSRLTYGIAGGQRTGTLTLSVDGKMTIDFDHVPLPLNSLKRKTGSEAGTVAKNEVGITLKLEGMIVVISFDGNIIGD